MARFKPSKEGAETLKKAAILAAGLQGDGRKGVLERVLPSLMSLPRKEKINSTDQKTLQNNTPSKLILEDVTCPSALSTRGVQVDRSYGHLDMTCSPDLSKRAGQMDTSNEQVAIPPMSRSDEQPTRTPRTDSSNEHLIRTSHILKAEAITRLTIPSDGDSKHETSMLHFFAASPNIITSNQRICDELKIPLGSVRRIMRKFEKKGLITKQPHIGKGRERGIHVLFTPKVDISGGHLKRTPRMDTSSHPYLKRR